MLGKPWLPLDTKAAGMDNASHRDYRSHVVTASQAQGAAQPEEQRLLQQPGAQ